MKYYKEFSKPQLVSLILLTIILSILTMILFFKEIFKNSNDDLNFSCSASFSNNYNIKGANYHANGVYFVTGYKKGRIYMAVQGTISSNTEKFSLNRKLLYSFTLPDRDSNNIYLLNLKDMDKNVLDNVPDSLIENIFGTYNKMGTTYIINELDNNALLFGSKYSPKFICMK